MKEIILFTILSLSLSITLDPCLYGISCDSSSDLCTSRFYSRHLNSICDTDSFTQNMTYSLSSSASCLKLHYPEAIEQECSVCKPGQYIRKNTEHSYRCEYCPIGFYSTSDNSEECTKCDKTAHNVYYYIPEIVNSEHIESVVIIDESGSITISNEKINVKEDCDVYISIDNQEDTKFQCGNDIIISLAKGKHSVDIKGYNLNMKLITIKGSGIGGAYQCNDAPIDSTLCSSIGEGYYYSQNLKTCTKCPLYTHLKEGRCIMDDILVNEAYMNKLLYTKFASEIKTDTVNDYTIHFENNEIYIRENDKSERLYDEIIDVKLVRGEEERGLIIYLAGSTGRGYVYIRCSKINGKTSSKKGNNLVLIINTNNICPTCLSSEVSYSESDCQNNQYTRIYRTSSSMCKIQKDPSDAITSIDTEDKSMFFSISDINYDLSKDLFYQKDFPLEDELLLGEIHNTTYIPEQTVILSCKSDSGSKWWIWLIVVIGILLIGAGIAVFVLYYKKIMCFNKESSGNDSNTELQSKQEISLTSKS